MTTFEDFTNDLDKLIQEHTERGLGLKVQRNQGGVYIFTEDATPLVRARHGIDDVIEFSHTVSEHHPFWLALDNSAEIVSILLDKWKENLFIEDLDAINWHIKNLQSSLYRLSKSSQR